MAGPVTDPRAGVLRVRYHALFADPELPVPVHRIAEVVQECGPADAQAEEMAMPELI